MPKKRVTDMSEIAKKPKKQSQERFEHRAELASLENGNILSLVQTDTEIAANVARILAQPSTRFKNDATDEEIEARTEEFFKWCLDTGTWPTVERYALAIGTTRETIRKWQHGVGCSDDRKAMMQQAIEMMAAFDADRVIRGKMPPIPYIFRSKNLYGMVDQQKVIIGSNEDKVQSAESLIAEARNLAGDFIDAEYTEVDKDG